MMKALLFSALLCAAASIAHAQQAPPTQGDLVSTGVNAWTFHTPDDGRTDLFIAPYGSWGGWNWDVATRFSANGDIQMRAKVKIGEIAPMYHGDYKLAVAGKIVSQSLYVVNPLQWADFVFEPTYKLMALPTLASYLKQYKHLPNIPSAKEVETKGYNVSEMDAKLLQTVEELTLHVIEIDNQNQQLQNRLAALEKQLATQQATK